MLNPQTTAHMTPGPIDRQNEVSGLCQCPGETRHTGQLPMRKRYTADETATNAASNLAICPERSRVELPARRQRTYGRLALPGILALQKCLDPLERRNGGLGNRQALRAHPGRQENVMSAPIDIAVDLDAIPPPLGHDGIPRPSRPCLHP